MKIVFKDSKIENGIIKVSLDGGFTFADYEIADVKESGIPLDSSQAFDKIQIKGSANVLKNLDVVSSINTLYESELLPEDITGIVLKNFDGKFDKALLQKYPKLTSVTIPEGVTSIDVYAFQGCRSLTSIAIPDSVTFIGGYAFDDCRNLTSIVIPDSVTSINGSAFRGCSKLESITIPDGGITIGSYTFYDCSSLTSVTIPDSVTTIMNSAFYNCKSLKTITYEGTEEQWNAILKGSYWNKNCPSDMVINYNYQG